MADKGCPDLLIVGQMLSQPVSIREFEDVALFEFHRRLGGTSQDWNSIEYKTRK